jgi:hypothetical protein
LTKVGVATGDHKDADTNTAVMEMATDYTEKPSMRLLSGGAPEN